MLVFFSLNFSVQLEKDVSRFVSMNHWKGMLKLVRWYSMNKSDLVQSSRNLEQILRKFDEKNNICQWFSLRINEIHLEYPKKKLATSTKNLYQKNSSKFNEDFLRLEIDRVKQRNFFQGNQLIGLLKYIRFLQISSIYRLITFDIHRPSQHISKDIFQLIQNEQIFREKFDIFLTR